jgi:hypothetical protein
MKTENPTKTELEFGDKDRDLFWGFSPRETGRLQLVLCDRWLGGLFSIESLPDPTLP